MSSIAEKAAEVGNDIDEALRQLSERQGNHEGRLKLIETSEDSDMAFVKEQLRDIKTTLDILLAMARLEEQRHEADHG